MTRRIPPILAALALLALLLALPVGAGSDLDLLGPDTPKAVRCGDNIFELLDHGALRFPAWHFRSKQAIGPEDSYLICGQYMGLEGDVVGWICATEIYTPIGVTSATHMCEAVDRLLKGEY